MRLYYMFKSILKLVEDAAKLEYHDIGQTEFKIFEYFNEDICFVWEKWYIHKKKINAEIYSENED